MKKSTIIILALCFAAAVLLYMYRGRIAQTLATASGNDGAYDAQDRATFNRMLDLIRASQFSRDENYILSSYKKLWAPGKPNAPTDSYGSINGTPTMSSGLTATVWTAWLRIYARYYNQVTGTVQDAPGVKHETAKAAAQLAVDIAKLWENYRTQTINNYLSNA